MTQVVLRNISLTRGSTPILRDVSLTVEPGEFCVFVGPSGCGKSTLLRLISGLDTDATGEIEIDGVPLADVPAAQRNVAMVFQGYALYPHMTVYDNMAFGLRRARVPVAEIELRVREASRILKLDDCLRRKPGELSGGQCQRVAIGRAIVKKPKVFLFDEPLSNLDAALRVDTRAEIARLHRDMRTASMLYVTHDQVEALTLADKIVLLRPLAIATSNTHPNAGARCETDAGDLPSVVQIGPPMALYHHPANLFAARFIGSPGMNLIETTVRALSEHGVGFELQGQACTAAVSPAGLAVGDAVTIGVRPEHMQCGSGPLLSTVVHVEALGEHSVVHAKLADSDKTVLAKTGNERLAVGDFLPLGLPGQALHVFRADGTAQRRLSYVSHVAA